MAIIKKTDNNTVDKDVGKFEYSYPVGGNVNGAATLGNSLTVPQMVKQQ